MVMRGQPGGRKILIWSGGLLFFLILIGGAGLFLWMLKAKIAQDPRLAALDRLVNASTSKPDFYFDAGFPRWFLGRVNINGDDSVSRAFNFLDSYKQLYGLDDPNLAVHLVKTQGQQDQYVYFTETYRGIPVYGGNILVMLDGEQVVTTLGPLLPARLVIDVQPTIEAGLAEDLARESLGAPSALLAGPTTPLIYDPALLGRGDRAARLAWKVFLRPGETWQILIDAQNGDILEKNVLSTSLDLDLEDANGNSAENSSCYWDTTDDDWIGDETGIIDDYQNDTDAVLAWFHAWDGYAFYGNTFRVWGYDFSDSVVEVYVHAGISNARFSAGVGCDLIEYASGWVSFDTFVHEYTHGVIYHSSTIGTGENETGASNEFFADTIAMLADPNDWNLGEDLTNGLGPIRSYDNHFINHMDRYAFSDNKYELMGILSTAAYRLAVGGNHNSWSWGVGRENMVTLMYNVMIYIPNGAGVTFMDVRNLAVSTSESAWGEKDACAVRNSFASVGLGLADWDCDGDLDPNLTNSDDDWWIDAKDNCPQDYNPLQEDYDKDGKGDVCDLDDDNDTINDTVDNCKWNPNPSQTDFDGDGKGDACDDDDDDGVLDYHDNCLDVPNPTQKDKDKDGLGDACDMDMDGDGVDEYDSLGNQQDNCLFISNPDQVDSDGDGYGDACDDCPDTYEEISAYTAVNPLLASLGAYPQPYQKDSDGDGIPDACDQSNVKRVPGSGTSNQLEIGASNALVLEFVDQNILQIPLPDCAQDGSGWISQGARQKLVITNSDLSLGFWVSDSFGRGVAKPKFMQAETTLEFQPLGLEFYQLNFIIPQWELKRKFTLDLSILCIEAESYSWEMPPFQQSVEPGALSTTVTLPVITSTFTMTLTPTLTFTPTLTPSLTPTRYLRPTRTPSLTPAPLNCSSFFSESACQVPCIWEINPFSGAMVCRNK